MGSQNIFCSEIFIKNIILVYGGYACRSAVLKKLGETSLQSVRSLYPWFAKLQSLCHIEDIAQIALDNKIDRLDSLRSKWDVQDSVLDNDYEFVEPVLSLRCALLSILQTGRHSQSIHTLQTLMKELEKAAIQARLANRHQVWLDTSGEGWHQSRFANKL